MDFTVYEIKKGFGVYRCTMPCGPILLYIWGGGGGGGAGVPWYLIFDFLGDLISDNWFFGESDVWYLIFLIQISDFCERVISDIWFFGGSYIWYLIFRGSNIWYLISDRVPSPPYIGVPWSVGKKFCITCKLWHLILQAWQKNSFCCPKQESSPIPAIFFVWKRTMQNSISEMMYWV